MLNQLDRTLGCLLGGAVGDALGAPIEFLSLEQIRSKFGPRGIDRYVAAYGRKGAITDDTQMTLWTAEGLIRADNRGAEKGIVDVPSVVWDSYQRWLSTQLGEGTVAAASSDVHLDGWLIQQSFMRNRRGPGSTNLTALTGGRMGRLGKPVNNSKGCGAVMRISPVGLTTPDPFRLACEVGVLTHGHPSGYLSAGAMAQIVATVMEGGTLDDSIDSALEHLSEWPGHEETTSAIVRARSFARERPRTPETVGQLGQGWIAEEALAIGLYCTLSATDFESGISLAVNHSGDSDSTGAIAGSLLGVVRGRDVIPDGLLADLEGRNVIEEVASDLVTHFLTQNTQGSDLDRYPPY